MPDQRQSDVLGALPRRRPQRRSAKRPERVPDSTAKPATAEPRQGTTKAAGRSSSKPRAVAGSRSGPKAASGSRSGPRAGAGSRSSGRAKTKADPLRQPPQPRGIPRQPRSPVPATRERPEILGTVVQAAAELTEIGLSLGAQILRRAVARLPRP